MYVYLNLCLTRAPILQSRPFGSLVSIIPPPRRRDTAYLREPSCVPFVSKLLPNFSAHYIPTAFSIACRTASVPCTVVGVGD
jgi:hypothetical protein